MYISKGRRVGFLSNIKLVIGSGQKIRFWKDVWVGERMLIESFPRLYSLSLGHNCSIGSMVRFSSMQFSWDFRFFRNLNDTELLICLGF